jgi:hypothetical protein
MWTPWAQLYFLDIVDRIICEAASAADEKKHRYVLVNGDIRR